jgi:DNA-directed RNA polymerase specialized sigma24 family protein
MMGNNPTVVTAVTRETGASLVSRIRDGDRAAEEELGNTYRRGVLLICHVRTRDREAARDLAQEIFIAVLRALRQEQLRDAEKLAAFI